MSIERDINNAVQLMFKHAKSVCSRNITNAIRTKAITIDESKIPGLDLLIQRSIDDAYIQSSKQITETVRAAIKSGKLIEGK